MLPKVYPGCILASQVYLRVYTSLSGVPQGVYNGGYTRVCTTVVIPGCI